MAARMRYVDLTGAALAFCQHHGALRGAALLHGHQCLALAGQNRALIVCQKLGFKGFNNRREQDHLTFPQAMAKPFIKALIN